MLPVRALCLHRRLPGSEIVGCSVFAAVVSLACSSSSSSSAANFVGMWTITSGTENETCDGKSTTTTLTNTTFTLAQGTASGTVEASNSTGCDFTLNANGDTLSAPAGTSCTFTMNGSTTTINFTEFMATLSGTTLSITNGANITINTAGVTEDCTGSETYMATQISK